MSNWLSKMVGKFFAEPRKPAAFAQKDAAAAHHDAAPVRSAGTEGMRDPPSRWSKEDAESDASFPASDPPGNY